MIGGSFIRAARVELERLRTERRRYQLLRDEASDAGNEHREFKAAFRLSRIAVEIDAIEKVLKVCARDDDTEEERT